VILKDQVLSSRAHSALLIGVYDLLIRYKMRGNIAQAHGLDSDFTDKEEVVVVPSDNIFQDDVTETVWAFDDWDYGENNKDDKDKM